MPLVGCSRVFSRIRAESALSGRLPGTREKTAVEREIGATDREIDRLVYEQYGLTDHEMAIVQEATQ